MSTYIVKRDGNSVKVCHVKRSSISSDQISYCFPNGNKKYKDNDDTGFIIWSIPPMTTCPHSTPHCREKCYAVKAWRAYPTVRVARTQNMRAAIAPNFVDDVVAIILYKANTGKNKNRKRIIVRIHESGDFFAAYYVDKWIEIARRVQAIDTRIVFWFYTKSFGFFLGKEMPENMRPRASVWDDTPEEDIAMIRELGWDIYTAVEKFADGDGFNHCRCEDCATCETPCGEKNGHTACEIH